MMSAGSNAPSFDENNSSFSVSSFGSDSNTFISKYQTEHNKVKKLEDKLAGYRTVVQQIPKFQESIAHLKKKDEDQARKIAYYKVIEEEQKQRILYLESQLQNVQVKQGLTDLDVCHPAKGSSSQTSSSPSFEVIGKYPYSNSIERDLQNSQLQEAICPSQTAEAITSVPCFSSAHRNTIPHDQKIQQVFSTASEGSPLPIVKRELTIGSAAGPPARTIGLSRGFSTNSVPSEQNLHYSTLNHLNSYPAVKGGVVSVLAFATGNKKPIWQMDYEALRKSEISKTAQQSSASSVNLTQAAQNLGNSTITSHISNPPSFTALGIYEGPSDTGTRPKEWKPLNTLDTQHREPTGLVKSRDLNVTNLANHGSVKTSENVCEIIDDYDEHSSRFDLTVNLSNLNMTEKFTEKISQLIEIPRSEDLMKFPSLHTNSPSSPASGENKVPQEQNPIYCQQNGAITFSTDEQSHLASQRESFVAMLEKSDSQSDMLYKIAENSKNMEAKLNEYETLIQRQHVQIQRLQCLPQLVQEEDNTRLREDFATLKKENETLLEFIAALKENKDTEAEPGWVSLLQLQSSVDPVRAHYPDSPIMRKIESLSNINIKLFQANKDWHNRWEILRQQNQEEKADLEAKVKSIETINKNLQENVASLEKELQRQSASVQDLMKMNDGVEEEKTALQRVNNALNTELLCLKTEVKDLTRSRRILESELTGLKISSRSRDNQQTGNKELQTEIGLLKQQLAIFAEDFEKERKDKILIEGKVDKVRKERDQIKLSLDTKLKKIIAQMRVLENDLRIKARQNADLLYQVDDLKLKLQHEQRKSALASQNLYSYQHPPASYQGPVSIPYNSSINGPMANIANTAGSVNHLFANSNPTSAGFLHQSSPEHLPGAWKCGHCTYVNYPNRSVCDICGYTNSNGESLPIAESVSGRNELQSRGEVRKWKDPGDIVVDTNLD